MDRDTFRDTMKKLSFIDRQPWMTDGTRAQFRHNPRTFFINTSEEATQRLWELIKPEGAADELDHHRARVYATLDLAHAALRCVDASDQKEPQTEHTLEQVSDAVAAVERMARELGYRLSEFRTAGKEQRDA